MTRVVVWTLILCCISKDTICKRSYLRITPKRLDKKLSYFFNGQPQSTAFVTGPRTRPRIQDKSNERTLEKWGNITSPVYIKDTKDNCDAIDTRLRTEKDRIRPKLRQPQRKQGYVLSAGPKYHVNLNFERQANNLDKGLSDNIQRSEAHSVIQFPSQRSRFLSIISSVSEKTTDIDLSTYVPSKIKS